MKYLLNTDICIYIIKTRSPSLLKRFKKISPDDIGISSVTLAELCYGVEKSQHQERNRLALQNFILPLEVLPFDDQASYYYGILRAELERKGAPIGSMDLMIAAHAQSLKSILVTHNIKEFQRISHLKIEDWSTPL